MPGDTVLCMPLVLQVSSALLPLSILLHSFGPSSLSHLGLSSHIFLMLPYHRLLLSEGISGVLSIPGL